MQAVVTADEMRALDKATIEDLGLPAITLMETAGRAVAAAALAMLGDLRGHVAVVCGPGNNGGDGFVVARVLRDRGHRRGRVPRRPGARRCKGDARAHLEILERAGGVVRSIASPRELVEVADAIATSALVVDALFGIGLAAADRRPPRRGRRVRSTRRRAGSPSTSRRASTPTPAGCSGHAVEAHRTVTMGALKIALVSAPGFAHCGDVEVADIGIPAGVLVDADVRAGLVEEADVRGWLPTPRLLDHKGTRGHVLVIGGAPGMRGAGRLASIAALRAGAGLVTLAADAAPQAIRPRARSTR